VPAPWSAPFSCYTSRVVSIRQRFYLAFILLIFLPGVLVSIILSRLYISALYATVSRQTEAVITQVAQSIRSEADGVSILTSALYHDQELRTLADQYARAAGTGERYLASTSLNDKLMSFFIYSNRVGAVVLYMRRGGVFYYSNYQNIRSVGGIDRSVYAEAKKDPGKVFLLDSLTGVAGNIGERFMLSVAVCPSPEEYDTNIDAILVMVRVPYFDTLMSRSQSETASDVVIYSRDGRVLLTSLPSSVTEDHLAGLVPPRADLEGAAATFRPVRLEGRSWLASSLRMESTGWTIVLLAGQSSITGRITSYQWYVYPALALLCVLFFLYAGIFTSRIANPIRAVADSMRRAGRGDYAVRVPATGIEEIAVLTESFNRMMEEIRTLTLEKEHQDRQRMKAELEALRFQINPHFVSNTLNSIRLMARAAKVDAIGDMTQALMRILADSYAGAGPFTHLAHEIANMHSYVGIMKVRFGENFDVDYRIAEGTQDCLVLKMILQPIVENGILHGISGCGRRGAMVLQARFEEAPDLGSTPLSEPGVVALPGRRLVLEVRDNGVGMDGERLASLFESPRDGHGDTGGLHRIGLANVMQRIRLNFGAPFGLSVESEAGAFTLVRFHLPVVVREGGGNA
jgi:two-component system, sensor histidine kinase YesM